MDLIFAMIKPFLRKEYYDVIHLHPVGDDLSQLFETDVPKSHFPSDLGGDLPGKALDYHEKTKLMIEEFRDYFEIDDEITQLKLEQFVNSEEYKYRDKYL